jgi:hypothetical protein
MKKKSISLIFEKGETQIKDAKRNGERRTQESLSIGEVTHCLSYSVEIEERSFSTSFVGLDKLPRQATLRRFSAGSTLT